MRKLTAIFFLLILLLPAFYKVGFFTFFQLNRDFIAENYCVNKDRPITMCYGQCFFNKGMELVDDTPNPDRFSSQVKIEMPGFIPHFAEFTFSFHQPSSNSFSLMTPRLCDGVSPFVFRPPLG